MTEPTMGRRPPQDDGAERACLGAMLLASAAIEDVNALITPADHYQPAHETIHQVIVDMHTAGRPVDAITVAHELAQRPGDRRGRSQLDIVGGAPYLHTLTADVPIVANAAHYASIVLQKAKLRALVAAGTKLASLGYAGDLEQADTYLGDAVEHINDVATRFGSVRDRTPRAANGEFSSHAGTTTGGAFILDAPDTPTSLWGSGEEVLLADGETLLIVGGQGLGKSTLGQQLTLGRCGVAGFHELLGYPITPGNRRTLYLAMDRPRQIARSMRRMVTEDQRPHLDELLTVWNGPPPYDLARHTDVLARMCAEYDADTVIVDSLKDAALGLTDDEVGAGWNRARQHAIAAGVQVVELHHNRKALSGAKATHPTIDDVYGSTWITSGAGSVLILAGAPGDAIVGLHHVKQPSEPVGPFRLLHDHQAGRTSIFHSVDLLALAATSIGGITAVDAARALSETDNPSDSEREKARRRLEKHVKDGRMHRKDGDTRAGIPHRYFRTTRTGT